MTNEHTLEDVNTKLRNLLEAHFPTFSDGDGSIVGSIKVDDGWADVVIRFVEDD